jgi:hypothetical protein
MAPITKSELSASHYLAKALFLPDLKWYGRYINVVVSGS